MAQASAEKSAPHRRWNLFQKTALATLIATIFLIFVGGIVRATGAGLGCPDWPRCWGLWWPPSSPEFIDAEAYDITQFNHTKMWVEYINRLIGVAVGLFIMATLACSVRYRKTDPAIFWGAFGSFILVLFQGWLGGQVVKSGLKPGVITIHMVLAILLMCLLLFITFRASADRFRLAFKERDASLYRKLGWVLFILTSVQIVLGSQVREALDMIKAHAPPDLDRGLWIDGVGFLDHIHRAFSWSVLLLSGWFAWKSYRSAMPVMYARTVRIAFVLIVFQVIFGIGLAYFGLPPVLQIFHLGFASLIICAEFLMILWCSEARRDASLSLAGTSA